jgi:hypothetical protein
MLYGYLVPKEKGFYESRKVKGQSTPLEKERVDNIGWHSPLVLAFATKGKENKESNISSSLPLCLLVYIQGLLFQGESKSALLRWVTKSNKTGKWYTALSHQSLFWCAIFLKVQSLFKGQQDTPQKSIFLVGAKHLGMPRFFSIKAFQCRCFFAPRSL